jgi:hypothetical protein
LTLQARLAAQPGARFEGVGPEFTHDDDVSLLIFNALSNGMGGVDWSGIELMAAKYGVEDIDGLTDRLITIKTHRTPDEDSLPIN